jgi:hypothetical protein
LKLQFGDGVLQDPTLGTIFGINEAIDIEPKYRPALESLRNELLDSFACLGSYSDQKLLEIENACRVGF